MYHMNSGIYVPYKSGIYVLSGTHVPYRLWVRYRYLLDFRLLRGQRILLLLLQLLRDLLLLELQRLDLGWGVEFCIWTLGLGLGLGFGIWGVGFVVWGWGSRLRIGFLVPGSWL